MASSYSSAFDDLLAQGREQLDRMTGRRPEPGAAAPARADPPAGQPGRATGERVILGTAGGIPFRLTVRQGD